MKMTTNLKVALVIGCLILGPFSYGLAEDTSEGTQNAQERIAYLKKLRDENPEAFRTELEKHRQGVNEKLQKLREENPEKFREIVQRKRQHFRDRLERVRKENPEKFRELMDKRRERLERRAERIKTNQPEKYEQLMKKRQERLKQFQQNHPERFHKFLKEHPHLHKHWQHANRGSIEGVHNEGDENDFHDQVDQTSGLNRHFEGGEHSVTPHNDKEHWRR